MYHGNLLPVTSRAKKEGECDGVDYKFVTIAQFESLIATEAFSKWGQKNGDYYGLPKYSNDDGVRKPSLTKRVSDESLHRPRVISIARSDLGFGFSMVEVSVQGRRGFYVTEVDPAGPSQGKLEASMQILAINGVDVTKSSTATATDALSSTGEVLQVMACYNPSGWADYQDMLRKESYVKAARIEDRVRALQGRNVRVVQLRKGETGYGMQLIKDDARGVMVVNYVQPDGAAGSTQQIRQGACRNGIGSGWLC